MKTFFRFIFFTLIKKLLLTIPVLWAVITLVFFLIHLIPGDPVLLYLGDTAKSEDIQKLRHEHGLDLPLGEQYLRLWIGERSSDLNSTEGVSKSKGILRGDFGTTFSGKSVTKQILRRYPNTLQLACMAMLVAILIGIPLGIASAIYSNSWWLSGIISTISLTGIALPSFVLGPLAIIIFSVQLHLLPVSGTGGIEHLVLPSFTLGAAMAAILTRLVRSSVLEELKEDYVRTARAKGLPERLVLYKHILKNSMIPVLTIIGLQFGVLLTGAIITETIFAWPGLGDLTIKAINEREYQQVQANILVIALTYVVVNTFIDILYRVFDPRIKIS